MLSTLRKLWSLLVLLYGLACLGFIARTPSNSDEWMLGEAAGSMGLCQLSMDDLAMALLTPWLFMWPVIVAGLAACVWRPSRLFRPWMTALAIAAVGLWLYRFMLFYPDCLKG